MKNYLLKSRNNYLAISGIASAIPIFTRNNLFYFIWILARLMKFLAFHKKSFSPQEWRLYAWFLQDFENFLTGAMVFVFLIGWIIGAICLLVSIILYLSGWDEHKGKRLIISGFFLFFIFLYLELGYVVDIFGGFGNATQARHLLLHPKNTFLSIRIKLE